MRRIWGGRQSSIHGRHRLSSPHPCIYSAWEWYICEIWVMCHVMSHVWMSHKNESCHTCIGNTACLLRTRHPCICSAWEWYICEIWAMCHVMSHVWMSHKNEHYESVIVTRAFAICLSSPPKYVFTMRMVYMWDISHQSHGSCHVTHVNEQYKWVMPQHTYGWAIWMSHAMSHVWMSHMNESCHVTHMNETWYE